MFNGNAHAPSLRHRFLGGLFHRRFRKDAQHLHSLPDHLLKDVGICREKIDLEIRRLRRF
ncbi:DUF1127 domain-containing protein [Roseobacter sp. MH60115]|uniref:DUF1127 domain-containing protein n=1 Tax=Roseobacter sp. MH60115 TaxID=2785324 RepID=UPI0018A32F99|nr:DUF1127 domain-containing protein [Roseobacter sp. MH60115]